jgi:hypothetical protein
MSATGDNKKARTNNRATHRVGRGVRTRRRDANGTAGENAGRAGGGAVIG